MARIQILSDLHLEMERSGAKPGQEFYHYGVEPTAPVLALLGDIGCVVHDAYFAWLEAQLARYELVLFVPGNHGLSSPVGTRRRWA